jgi:hypothetical protein
VHRKVYHVGWTLVTLYRCAHDPAHRWPGEITLNMARFAFSQAPRPDMQGDLFYNQAA